MSLKLIDYEKRNGTLDCVMTVERSYWWFGARKKRFVVRGGCTVWHYYPSGKRCGTLLECELSELEKVIKWREEDHD